MSECVAFGWASQLFEGPCTAQLSMDVSVKLLEKAIEMAQAEASKQCPQGCKCEGKATPIGPPVCYPYKMAGKQYHRWEVTAVFDGECKCPQVTGPRDINTGIEPGRLRAVIESLPEKPIGHGRCQLIKRRHSPGGGWTVGCGGSCAKEGRRCPRNPQMWTDENGNVGLRCVCS